MKRALAFVAVLVTALAGCDRIPGTVQNEARQALSKVLFDPYSAKIEVQDSTEETICGTVNGKNTHGAYVGAQPFIAARNGDGVAIFQGLPTSTDVSLLALTETGTPQFRESALEIGLRCDFVTEWNARCPNAEKMSFNDICEAWQTTDSMVELILSYR